MLVGEGMRLLANFLFPDPSFHLFELVANVSVGLLWMVIIFKLEHPPAAGLVVVMVLDIRNVEAMLIILSAAIVLILI